MTNSVPAEITAVESAINAADYDAAMALINSNDR